MTQICHERLRKITATDRHHAWCEAGKEIHRLFHQGVGGFAIVWFGSHLSNVSYTAAWPLCHWGCLRGVTILAAKLCKQLRGDWASFNRPRQSCQVHGAASLALLGEGSRPPCKALTVSGWEWLALGAHMWHCMNDPCLCHVVWLLWSQPYLCRFAGQ